MAAVATPPRKASEQSAGSLPTKARATPYNNRQSRPKAPFRAPPQFNRGHRIRRRDQSNTEIVLSLVSWMPWWVNLLLAVAIFGALHHLGMESAQALQDTRDGVGASSPISSTMGSVFFPIMKWLASLFFLRAAFASVSRSRFKRKTATGSVRPKVVGVRGSQRVAPEPEESGPPAPDCPLCSAEMRLRTRKADGQSFYGCTHFPACKGMVNV